MFSLKNVVGTAFSKSHSKSEFQLNICFLTCRIWIRRHQLLIEILCQRAQIRGCIRVLRVAEHHFTAVAAHPQWARVTHELARHLLVTAAATEDLAADATVVTAPEGVELVAALVALATVRIRHPVLLEVGVSVCLRSLQGQRIRR